MWWLKLILILWLPISTQSRISQYLNQPHINRGVKGFYPSTKEPTERPHALSGDKRDHSSWHRGYPTQQINVVALQWTPRGSIQHS